MLINFNDISEITIPNLNDGIGAVTAQMFSEPNVKIMFSKLPAGASIGLHEHNSGSDINYILSGTGKAICDEKEEQLVAGVCHYCPKGSSHSIINTGDEDLVLFTVVPVQ